MPIVRRPTYPYTESPPINDFRTLLYGRFVIWGTEPRLNSYELTKYNYMLFRIACHDIFPISHVHTIPIDRCVFLYALSIDDSIIKNWWKQVAAYRSTTDGDLKPLSRILKSQMGSLCLANPR